MAYVYDTKKRASTFVAKKNKKAKKYLWKFQKRSKGGYLVYKTKK